MYKLLILFCFFPAFFLKTNAKVVIVKKPPFIVKVREIVKIDSAAVHVHNFNAGALAKFHNNPDFNYQDIIVHESIWARFWFWFWELIARLFGGMQPTDTPSIPFVKYIVIALAIGLFIFLIVKLLGLNLTNIFKRDSKDIEIPYTESLENIHQITFDEEIEKALAQRNYRLAIRLLYLSTLKQLNDAQLIQWQMEKTNSVYLNELKNPGQRQSFSILTRQFEYVWYGDFPVDGTSFQQINSLFYDFKKMLK